VGLGAAEGDLGEPLPYGDFQGPPLEVFTVTGRLVETKVETDRTTITIQTSGGAGTGFLAETCVFFGEDGRELSSSNFLERYRNRAITIDFIENEKDEDAIIECRAGEV
jgi:hypothetical protein